MTKHLMIRVKTYGACEAEPEFAAILVDANSARLMRGFHNSYLAGHPSIEGSTYRASVLKGGLCTWLLPVGEVFPILGAFGLMENLAPFSYRAVEVEDFTVVSKNGIRFCGKIKGSEALVVSEVVTAETFK